MPVFVVQDDGTAVGKPFQSGNNLVGLFGHGFVEIFAGFVILVDLSCLFQSKREVFLRQQVYCFLAVLDASRSVDSRTYLEYDVADGNLFFRQPAYVDNGFQPHARIAVELLQAMIGKDAVLSHNRYNVRGYADRNQVQ